MQGPSDRGFVLLVMLGVLAAGSLAIALAVQSAVPIAAERTFATDDRLAAAQSALRVAYRRAGAFPSSLDALAGAAALPTQGDWRLDPWGQVQDLGYAAVAAGATVRSRGIDGALNTSDDVVFAVPAEPQLRARQRGRLRLLRAQLLRSSYRWSAAMTPAAQTQMRTAMRTLAVNQRRWLTATPAERTAITAANSAAAAVIQGLRTTYSLPPLPPSLTGAGGLMQMLGTSDARAVDGAGAALRLDNDLGVAARGADGLGGTDDDM
jgi:hypothetical protein